MNENRKQMIGQAQKAKFARIEDALREGLNKAQRQGIAAGAYAVCKTVLEKADDETMNNEQKLDEIRRFCKSFGEIAKAEEKRSAEPQEKPAEPEAPAEEAPTDAV